MKGVIYTRVSSDEQVKGTSLEFQEDLCRKYCRQRGIEISAVFREEGESAKSLNLKNRKKFLEALDYCRKNKNRIQAFVVLRLDRFARNTEDHFAVRKVLLDCGTSVHSVSEPIGNKPAEKFIETVLAGAAEYENAIRKQRCTDGMSSKINQGIFPWNPPMGYKSLQFKKRGEKKTAPDPPDESFPLIQKALREFSRGIYTQAELAKLLDKWGLNIIRGKTTTPQTVDRMTGRYLKFYAGIIVNPWTGEEKEGLHKPMITKEEMQKIQLIRRGKSNSVKHHKYNPNFPLRKTILCGTCKRPITGSAPTGRSGKYYYYHCPTKDCAMYGKSIQKKILEADFEKYLNKITPKEKFLAVFKESVLDLWQEREKGIKDESLKFKNLLQKLHEKRKRIFEMREEGSYTKEEFMERKKEVDEEITTAQISLDESGIEAFNIESALTYAVEFCRNLGSQWFSLPVAVRFRFQKLIFPDGISYDKKTRFGTARLGVIFKLNQAFLRAKSQEKSHLVECLRDNWNNFIREMQEWQELREALLNC